jgi:hypothetical protein
LTCRDSILPQCVLPEPIKPIRKILIPPNPLKGEF